MAQPTLEELARKHLEQAQKMLNTGGPTAEELMKAPKVQQQVKMLHIGSYIGWALLLLGLCLLAWNAGWLVTLAVSLLILGNNAVNNSKIGLAILDLTARILPMIR